MPLLTAALGVGLLGTATTIALFRIATATTFSLLDLSLAASARVQLVWLAGCLTVVFWAGVGTWRSAARADFRAKFITWMVIVLAACLSLPSLARTGQTAAELVGIAVFRDPMGAPAKVTREGTRLKISGRLAQGSAARLTAALRTNPGTTEIILSSPGGRIAEARDMAAAVDRYGIDTRATGQCESACTLVLLAGSRRYATSGTKIGFHQSTMPGFTAVDDDLMTSETRDFFLESGIAPAFVSRAFSTSSKDMWYPTKGELLQSGFLTSIPVEWELRLLAEEVGARLPLRLDKMTTLTKVEAVGKTLTSTYVIEARASEIDRPYLVRFAAKQAKSELCKNQETREVIFGGARMVRNYYDLERALVADVSVSSC